MMEVAVVPEQVVMQRGGEASAERLIVQRLTEGLAPAGVEIVRETEHAIELRVRLAGWKLSTIILGREAAARLFDDPAREIKLEYLVRDVRRSAACRSRWSYPRFRG